MNLDPLKPYADLFKVGAALLLATVLGFVFWSAGAGKWKAKHDVEVAAHKATKAEHARVLDDLAQKTAAVAAKAKAASAGLAADRKTNDARYDKAVSDAKRARADLRAALQRGDIQLQPWWAFDPAGALTGDSGAAAGGQDGFAELRAESLLQGVQDGYDADAWIGWLQSEIVSTRQRVIEAGCAVEASP